MKLWHGTSSLYLDQKLRDGLDPSCSCYDHICLSSSKDLATHFGQEMARWEKAEFVLLSIEMNELSPNDLCHEMGWIGNSLEEAEGRKCLQEEPLDMLRNHQVIGYKKIIPPNLLRLEENGAAPHQHRQQKGAKAPLS